MVDGSPSPTEAELKAARELKATGLAQRLLLVEDLRVVYCPVPKVASSNWKVLFAKFAGSSMSTRDLRILHDRDRTPLSFLCDASDDLVARALAPRFRWFKFLFVRHPETRAVSGYLNKIRDIHRQYAVDPDANKDYEAYIASLYSWPYTKEHNLREEDPPYFDEFLTAIAEKLAAPNADPLDVLNEHWGFQARMCGLTGDQGRMQYDYMGRFENLRQDALVALKRMGKGDTHFLSQAEVNFPSSGTDHEFGALMVNGTREMVRSIYAEDFQVLGYK